MVRLIWARLFALTNVDKLLELILDLWVTVHGSVRVRTVSCSSETRVARLDRAHRSVVTRVCARSGFARLGRDMTSKINK